MNEPLQQKRTESEEIRCRLITKPALFLMEAYLPASLIQKVNTHIDATRKAAGDHAPRLVGQIRRHHESAQLTIDVKDPAPAALAATIVQIAEEYIRQQGFEAKATASDMWSVHSYAGDYNPLHDHGARTPLGLSSILYLKVPKEIAAAPDCPHGAAPTLNNASGNCDGFTQFIWGATGMKDFSLLRPATQQYVKPEVGKLLIFPNWLLHRVEPYFGEEERRTLSLNMDVEFNEPGWY
jgi:Putative 2OG-Fe(II) oxygenase